MSEFQKAEARLQGRGFSKNVRIVADTREMPEEEWLEHRKKGFGGSDASKILGVSRFGTAMDTFLDKAGLKERGEQTEGMELGHFFEPYIADLYKERTGRPVERVNFLLSNPTSAPNLLVNLDRITKHEELGWGVLEIKNLSGFWTEEQIRQEYTPQVTQYMAVTGLKWAVIFGTVGGTSTFEIMVKWEDVALSAADIIYRAAILRKCVDDMTPPSLESEEWADQAGENWKKSEDVLRDGSAGKEEVHLSGIKGMALERVLSLKEEIKEKTAEMKALQATVTDGALKPAVFYHGDSKATWRYQGESKSVDSKILKKDFPDVYEQVTKTKKGYWVFR